MLLICYIHWFILVQFVSWDYVFHQWVWIRCGTWPVLLGSQGGEAVLIEIPETVTLELTEDPHTL